MTVKLAKFFTNNNNNNNNMNANATSIIQTISASPPTPPLSSTILPANTQLYYYQQEPKQKQKQKQKQKLTQNQNQNQKQKHNPYNAYMMNDDDDYDDDDNMSVYSTATSIMTTRDHPFNNSQRPLLAERKPQLLYNKKKLTNQANNSQKHLNNQSNQHYHQQKLEQKSYISPYVQQQKRDSAKGLHGFNDFDILSKQYNKHLQSPHIGYPYGSPPSPTSNATDFIFDTITPINISDDIYNVGGVDGNVKNIINAATNITNNNNQNKSNCANNSTILSTTRYGNVNSYANIPETLTPTATSKAITQLYNRTDFKNSDINNDCYSGQTQVGINASSNSGVVGSRFEDDFCTTTTTAATTTPTATITSTPTLAKRQQQQEQQQPTQQSKLNNIHYENGPYIFGIPPERQINFGHIPAVGNAFNDSKNTVIETNVCRITMQTSCDTSSSSRDDSNSSGSNKGAKCLLRKQNSKKNTKKGGKSSKANNGGIIATTPTIKCVVVGDGAVGKTNLILSYLENRFNPDHIPTASDIYNADVMVNDSPVHLTLCDTAGQDTLDPLRELCYPDSDVFVLCFSVAKPETFHAIKRKWAPKFAKTKASLILVGTQADLRTNPNMLNILQNNGEKPISYADAWDLATTIGAKYIETSSVTQEKVKEVFDTAIWESLVPTTLPPTPSFWRKFFCLA